MLGAIALVVFVFIFFLLPETKGRSLEDMSLYFAEVTNDNSVLEAEKRVINGRQNMGAVEMTPSHSAAPMPTGEVA